MTVQETGSELEALLLESRLLKQEAPPFNRLSTGYTALPFVKLTLSDPYPRLLLTRDFRDDGSHYLGPFPRVESATAVLTALQRLSPLRTCDDVIRPGVAPQPCAAFHVRTCAAPCVGQPAAAMYWGHVEDLLALLSQGREGIVRRLAEARQRAVDSLRFERARHVHGVLTALEEATVGASLALLPVAARNWAVIVERPPPGRPDVFFICRGLFAGRILLDGHRSEGQALSTLLHSGAWRRSDRPREGAAAVDELRIVSSWLRRTQPSARWVPCDVEGGLAQVAAVLERALSPSA